MKKFIFKPGFFLLSIGLLFSATAMKAQSNVTIDASQCVSNFKFTDSAGTQDKEYNGIYTGGYSLGYRWIHESGFMLHPRLGMRKAGATYVYDAINYSWNLQYADLRVGIGYMYNKTRVMPYLVVSPYYAMLLKATQSLNNENFDILKSNALQKNDFGVFITPGMQMKLSDSFSFFTEFNYMMGLQNIEKNSGEKAYNKAIGFTLGAAFTITKEK